MKSKTQSGFGILPVMIVVLLAAMSGIGYNVYRQQENQKAQQASLQSDNAPVDPTASLPDIQQQVASTLDPLLTGDESFISEQADSRMIFKDDETGLLVSAESEKAATRFTLNTQPSYETAYEIMRRTEEKLKAYGFAYFSGRQLSDATDETNIGGVAYSRNDDYCYLSILNSSYFEIGCVTVERSTINTEAKALKPYYEASARYFEEKYPDETYEHTEVIVLREETRKDINGMYEVVSGSLGGVADINGYYEVQGGGRMDFYRELNSDWMVGPNSGNGGAGSCEEFDSAILQTVYAEDGCWNRATDSITTVAEYWQ